MDKTQVALAQPLAYILITTMACACRTLSPDKLVKKTISKVTGEVQVTGQKKGLQRSGEYPLEFGLAVSTLIHPSRAGPVSNPERGGGLHF